MNRRDAIIGLGAGALAIAGCNRPPVPVKETKKNDCPCPPAVKKPPELAELHICAFHLDPVAGTNFQMEVEHYCQSLSEDLHQCLLYDGTGKGARLIGVEYVVSDKIYQTLPAEEKALWHPHRYEIEAGLLMTPELPLDCEEKVMKLLVNTWGKTWHTWPDPQTSIPLGKPRLMWSALKDGDVRPELVASREKRLQVNIEDVRKRRQKWFAKSS